MIERAKKTVEACGPRPENDVPSCWVLCTDVDPFFGSTGSSASGIQELGRWYPVDGTKTWRFPSPDRKTHAFLNIPSRAGGAFRKREALYLGVLGVPEDREVDCLFLLRYFGSH